MYFGILLEIPWYFHRLDVEPKEKELQVIETRKEGNKSTKYFTVEYLFSSLTVRSTFSRSSCFTLHVNNCQLLDLALFALTQNFDLVTKCF